MDGNAEEKKREKKKKKKALRQIAISRVPFHYIYHLTSLTEANISVLEQFIYLFDVVGLINYPNTWCYKKKL